MIKEISNYEEFKLELQNGNVLVDFYAVWCGPCQMLAPIVDEVEEEHPELKVLRVDVDKVPDAAAEYNVYSIPTLLHFVGGKKVNETVGFMPKARLEKFLGF